MAKERKFPKSINLFGTKFKIKYVKWLELEHGEYDYGVCNNTKQEITIAVGAPNGVSFSDETIELTLIHEIVHAILMSGQILDTNNNESAVEWIARCIYSIFKFK